MSTEPHLRRYRTWTAAQVTRRRDAALRLLVEGWGVTQIGDILGIHPSTVSGDLDVVWPDRPRSRQRRRSPYPVVNWLDEPPDVHDPVTPIIQSFISSMTAINYRNSMAHAMTDAAARNAGPWIADFRKTADALTQISNSLQRIIEDETYRQRMIRTAEGRDDLGRK